MKSRTTHKLAALVTGAALAFSFPVASSVGNPGGVPNGGVGSSKACPGKGDQGKGPKKSAPNGKGKKCGFEK